MRPSVSGKSSEKRSVAKYGRLFLSIAHARVHQLHTSKKVRANKSIRTSTSSVSWVPVGRY
jgi:hypothetical protein